MDFGITLIKRALSALLLLSGIAQGQTLLTVTNARIDVANDPAFTLSGPAGSYRITYTVTAGGTPIDLNDGSTFRLEVWASDGFRIVNITNNSGAEINPSAGQVRFVLPSIGAGQYRLRGIATPVSGDTNANWNLTHHILTVTNSAASSGINLDLRDITADTVTADFFYGDGAGLTNIAVPGDGQGITQLVSGALGGTVVSNVGGIAYVSATNGSSSTATDTSGIQAPYTNSPASPVTINATNGWWQVLTATGTTSILIADKPVTNNGASVRLDYWTLHATTITNIEGYASLSISTSAVNVLLFDNPADRGITNWIVEQLYP